MSDEHGECREVTAAEIDAVLGHVLPSPLRAAGFEPVGSVRLRIPPIVIAQIAAS